jgi:hypothetical protein
MGWRSDEKEAKRLAGEAVKAHRKGASKVTVNDLLRQSKLIGERAARGKAGEDRQMREASRGGKVTGFLFGTNKSKW